MYKIGSMPKSIPIGYTGETNFRKIEIDMNAWLDKMPAGVPSIVHVRPGESKTDAYVAVTEFDRENGILSWTITAADIGTLEGEGEMQVWLEETENDTVNKRGKSVIVTTKVIEAANDPDENVPSSQEAFLEQVTNLKTQTVTAKEAAEDAQAAAEDAQEAAEQAAEDAENVNLHPAYIDETTKNWMVYDAANHEYVDTQIKAQGQDATPTLVCTAYADLTFPVTKDTLCYKDGTLYKAKQDISTSEAWTAAHWDATNLATEQRLLKTAIQGKYEKPSGGIPSTDMTQAVQDALADAESAYQKPSGGIPASDIADGVIPVVDSALSYSSENAVQNKVVKGALDTKAPVIINTATGNPAVFNDGGGMPLKSMLIPFTPQQSGTGDPSPSNIRSIIPWNGLKVYQSGADTSNPTETDISFPSPVYGGEHEAVSGKLMDGWKVETLDDVNAWTDSGTFISYTNHSFTDREVGNSFIGICSAMPIKNNVPSGTAYMRWGGVDAPNVLIAPNGSGLTLEDVKTLSGQGKIVLAYPLATPTEQTLTGHQLTALVGNNTIWSDADGLLTVAYPADTKTYISNLIATAIASL